MKRKMFYNVFFVSLTVFLVSCIVISAVLYSHFQDAYTLPLLLKDLLLPIIILLIFTVMFSLFAASRISKKIIEPINQINFGNPSESEVYPEVQPLIERIADQNEQISRQMEEIKAEHTRQDTMRREFTANVSHELKTPLTSISGYAEIIKGGLVKPEDIPSFAGRIYDEAQRLITLVGDIIRLSQLDEINARHTLSDIDLYELAESTVHHFENIAAEQQVAVKLTGTHEIINGSVRIIEEIVFNLCDNAIKYNTRGGTVDIRVTRKNGRVVLSVKDSGIGIPEEDLDRIFERFYRVDKSHSKEVGGTGLGLSIVKHGVAYHNAEISIKSAIGKGTAVTVTFPE